MSMKIFSVSGLPLSVSKEVVYVVIDEDAVKARKQLDERFKDHLFTTEEWEEYHKDVKLNEIPLDKPKLMILC